MSNNIDLKIYVDNKKKLIIKVKDYNLKLEELRDLLGYSIQDSDVFIKKDSGDEECIESELEETITIQELLVDNAIHLKSQESIMKSFGHDSGFGFLTKGIASLNTSSLHDATTADTTTASTGSTTTDAANGDGSEKKRSLVNINTVDNQVNIIEYCRSFPLKFALDSETFKGTTEVVEWDIHTALIYPSDSSVSYLTKSTFNSIEHNAHKSGLYSWNASGSFKTIADATHTGNVENDKAKNSTSTTAYTYTHGLVARFVVNVGNQKIRINDSTISKLKSVSKDLAGLKATLKTIGFFPTQFTFGGKLATTAFKANCTESEKDSFALKLATDFKASLLNGSALKAQAGSNINRSSNNDNSVKSDYSFEETIVCGGDSTLRDNFDEYLLSLESYNNCSVIEISNIKSIWEVLSIQDPALYKECQETLGIDSKKHQIEVYSNTGSKGKSEFKINNESHLSAGKGFNIVLLDSNYIRVDSKNFDTSSKFVGLFVNRSYKFARYLEKVEKGNVILISENGGGFAALDEKGRDALEKIGIKRVEYFSSHSTFCAIVKKDFKCTQNSADNSPSSCIDTFF